MKKYLPLILPTIAVLVLLFLGVRWYQNRTKTPLTPPEVTAGQEIENLSASELATLENLQKGMGNYKTIKMTGSGIGEIRYESKNGKVFFSVNANLAVDNNQVYTLYLKDALASDFVKTDTLSVGKGGLTASAAVSSDKLPLQIQVRLGEQVVLSGEIQAEK